MFVCGGKLEADVQLSLSVTVCMQFNYIETSIMVSKRTLLYSKTDFMFGKSKGKW